MKKHIWILLGALATAAARASAHEGVSAEIAALDRKIAQHPGDASLLVRRAALLRREGHPSRALADLARADSRDPGRRDVLLERGLALFARGDRRGAETALDRFLASGAPAVATPSATSRAAAPTRPPATSIAPPRATRRRSRRSGARPPSASRSSASSPAGAASPAREPSSTR
jgi:Flp pilus assembly protein TadD